MYTSLTVSDKEIADAKSTLEWFNQSQDELMTAAENGLLNRST